MFSNILTLLAVLASIGILIDNVLIEDAAKREKQLLAAIFRRLSTFSGKDLTLAILFRFNALFDAVYGHRHLSWRCFMRSVASSILALVLAIVTTYVVGVRYSLGLFRDSDSLSSVMAAFAEAFSRPQLAALLVQNIVLDYVSLAETRALMRSRLARSMTGLVAILAIDIAFNFALVTVPLAIEYLSLGYWARLPVLRPYTNTYVTDRTLADFVVTFNDGFGQKQLMLPLITSTFFTSLVFYWFAGAALVLRVVDKGKARLQRAVSWLLGRDRPMTACLSILGVFASLSIAIDSALARSSAHTMMRKVSPFIEYLAGRPQTTTAVTSTRARDVLLGRHVLQWGAQTGPEQGWTDATGTITASDFDGLITISGESVIGTAGRVSVTGVVTQVDDGGFTLNGEMALRLGPDYFTLDNKQLGLLVTNVSELYGAREGAQEEQNRYGGIRFVRGDISWYWCCAHIPGSDAYVRILF